MPFFVHNFIILFWMGSFSYESLLNRILKMLLELVYILHLKIWHYHILCYKSVPWEIFSTKRVIQNVFGICRDYIYQRLLYSDSVKNLSYWLFPKVLVWLFSIIHFRKHFSPQPLFHRISSRKKTGGLAEHDLVLYFQNVYFPTLLGKLYWEHIRDRNIFLISYQ